MFTPSKIKIKIKNTDKLTSNCQHFKACSWITINSRMQLKDSTRYTPDKTIQVYEYASMDMIQ